MHKFARFLDPRNTIEGKIVTAILLVVLVFSMANLSAIVENASATGSNDNASNKTETELSVSEGAAGQTEDGAGSYADANTVNKPMVITALDQENGKEDVESQSSVAGGGDSSKVNPSEVTVGDPEGKTPEGDSPDGNMLVAQSDEPVAQNKTYFDTIKKQIEDPNGPSEVALSESFTATTAITVSRDVTIAGADNISIDRDLQTHSIFVVEKNGNLTLNNVKLTSNEYLGKKYSKNDVSPVITSGSLSLNGSSISGFVAANGGALTVDGGVALLIDANIDKNQARNASGYAYGGGVCVLNGELQAIDGTTISDNVACSLANRRYGQIYGGIGGGVYVKSGAKAVINSVTISGNEAGKKAPTSFDTPAAGAGGGIYLDKGASFSMEGKATLVADNKAFAWASQTDDDKRCGGGIFVKYGSDDIQIKEGTIRNNFAQSPGGGIYIHVGKMQMSSVAIIKNRLNDNNGSDGGGIWFCELALNGGQFYATNGALITDNKAKSKGDDFSSIEPWFYEKNIALPERLPDGTKSDWENDRSTSSINELKEELSKVQISENGLREFISKYQNDATLELRNLVKGSYDLGKYALTIQDNSASNGGGIACNGNLIIGENKDISLSLKKLWKNADGSDMNEESLPNSIKVNVYNKGKLIDEVVLSKENGWQKTLIDLPYNGDYTVKEIDENGNEVSDYSVGYQYGSVAEGENGPSSLIPGQAVETAEREYDVTITNTAAVPFGELVINKSFSGAPFDMGNGVGTSTAVFHVEGFQPVVAGSEGNLDDASQFTKFYDNYVSINYGDENPSVVLSDLPTGATYRVTEILYADSGFISNGQTIQTQLLGSGSDSKIEFSFDNTIDGEHPNQGIVNRYSFSSEGNTVNGNRIEQAA